jgi:hypothetical protein
MVTQVLRFVCCHQAVQKEQINILQEVFQEWLQIHDIDYDFWIYSGNEWRARGESVLKKAHAVIAFENDLVNILNYSASWKVEDELQDLAAGFGYYFEIGKHWNIGFYPLDPLPELLAASTSYAELLRHHNWIAKRDRILARSGVQCEECGTKGHPLHVHHCYYRMGRLPWQYPDGAFLSLCPACHKQRAQAELRFRMFMTRLRIDKLQQIRKTNSSLGFGEVNKL